MYVKIQKSSPIQFEFFRLDWIGLVEYLVQFWSQIFQSKIFRNEVGLRYNPIQSSLFAPLPRTTVELASSSGHRDPKPCRSKSPIRGFEDFFNTRSKESSITRADLRRFRSQYFIPSAFRLKILSRKDHLKSSRGLIRSI